MFSYACLYAGRVMMRFDVFRYVLTERGNKRRQLLIRTKGVRLFHLHLARMKLFPNIFPKSSNFQKLLFWRLDFCFSADITIVAASLVETSCTLDYIMVSMIQMLDKALFYKRCLCSGQWVECRTPDYLTVLFNQ